MDTNKKKKYNRTDDDLSSISDTISNPNDLDKKNTNLNSGTLQANFTMNLNLSNQNLSTIEAHKISQRIKVYRSFFLKIILPERHLLMETLPISHNNREIDSNGFMPFPPSFETSFYTLYDKGLFFKTQTTRNLKIFYFCVSKNEKIIAL
jgi:hypothetical protein